VGIPDKLRRLFTSSTFYRCRNCGYLLPKEEATISGYDSQNSLHHIHCPRCGKIIKHAP
jgi:predicted RNA-binding Zn-ribbon protein involved in translation (DUF1610 family)